MSSKLNTFTESISAIEQTMAEKWIPESWKPLAAEIEATRRAVRDLIIESMGQKQTQALVKPEQIDPAEQRKIAARIGSTSVYRRRIPDLMETMGQSISKLKIDALNHIYSRSAEHIVGAFNAHTPDGVDFEWEPRAEEKAKLQGMFIDGLSWGQTVRIAVRPFSQRLRAIVTQSIVDHGRSADAQRAILDRFDGMWGTMEKQLLSKFAAFARWGYKRAEIDLRNIVKG